MKRKLPQTHIFDKKKKERENRISDCDGTRTGYRSKYVGPFSIIYDNKSVFGASYGLLILCHVFLDCSTLAELMPFKNHTLFAFISNEELSKEL